jgi:hypothetical protein
MQRHAGVSAEVINKLYIAKLQNKELKPSTPLHDQSITPSLNFSHKLGVVRM